MSLVQKITCLLALIVSLSSTMQAQSVVINEFMAENDTITMITDESYQYDDWIELFNLGNTPVDLSGFFMTDKKSELNKWTFPNGTIIPANGYLIVWADNDENQGALHTNFKLSKNGEFIALTSPSFAILDSVSFGEQEKAVAMARIPNGTGDFTERAPTFSTNNQGTTSLDIPIATKSFFQVSPNPTTQKEVFLSLRNFTQAANYQIDILSLTGQRLYTSNHHFLAGQSNFRIDLSGFDAGIYFIQLQNGPTRFSQKLIIQ